jgi:hypothetical protein
MEEMRNPQKQLDNRKRSDRIEDLGQDGMIILK